MIKKKKFVQLSHLDDAHLCITLLLLLLLNVTRYRGDRRSIKTYISMAVAVNGGQYEGWVKCQQLAAKSAIVFVHIEWIYVIKFA